MEKAISRLRGAYKIPSTPRIRFVDQECVKYDWEKIKASCVLIINCKGVAFAVVPKNTTIAPIFFNVSSDEELIIEIVNCFEMWIKYYAMRNYE